VVCAPAVSFFEGALNITQLLGGGSTAPCFTAFMTETRSSTSTTASLEDFVLHKFSVCGMSITKTCAGPGVLNANKTGITYTFGGTVTNTGSGAISNVTIVDALPDGSSKISYTVGGNTATTPTSITSLLPGAANAVSWSVSFDSTLGTVQNSAYAKGSTTSGGTPDALCTTSGTLCSAYSDPVAECSSTTISTVTISKNCGVPAEYLTANAPALPGTQLVAGTGEVAVQVNFSGQVCNTGQLNLSGVTLKDSPDTTTTIITPSSPFPVAVGTCVNYAGSYLPPSSAVAANDLGGAKGRYAFTDEIKVTGATPPLGTIGHEGTCTSGFAADAQACATAICNICPGTNGGALCGGN